MKTRSDNKVMVTSDRKENIYEDGVRLQASGSHLLHGQQLHDSHPHQDHDSNNGNGWTGQGVCVRVCLCEIRERKRKIACKDQCWLVPEAGR